MKTSLMEDSADFVLEEGIKLTKSKFGFIGFMKDGENVLTIHSWSKSAMEECPREKNVERSEIQCGEYTQ